MKTFFAGIFAFFAVVFFVLQPTPAAAQERFPYVVLSPTGPAVNNEAKSIQLSLVNMGIPLRRVEITTYFSGDHMPETGFRFEQLNTEQYGLAYKSHSISPVPGTTQAKLITIYEAVQPQGYNQGSAQIPLGNFIYVPNNDPFSGSISRSETKLTDVDGNLLPRVEVSTNHQWYVPGISTPQDTLDTYSLSFTSDLIRHWWPTAPNTLQQLDAAIWKDSDGTNVKRFTNLSASWQVDANYVEIVQTSSRYMDRCPIERVGNNRACIVFTIHLRTHQPGRSNVMLRVVDNETGREAWNSSTIEVYPLESPVAVSGPQQPTASPNVLATATPAPSFIPESRISTEEFEEVKQTVTYLQTELEQQQRELDETKGVLQRILGMLRRVFRW